MVAKPIAGAAEELADTESVETENGFVDSQDETVRPPSSHREAIQRTISAIGKMDRSDAKHFNKTTGAPSVYVLTDFLGWQITKELRDEAWAIIQEHQTRPATEHEAVPAPQEKIAPADVKPSPQPTARIVKRRDGVRKREDVGMPGMWAVFDLNAKRSPRVHTPIGDGPAYQLKADTPTWMPSAHAAKFLSDPSFVVLDEKKIQINNIPHADSLRAGESATILDLEPDEVVAKLGELSDQALLARANRLPGGEVYAPDASRSELEAFCSTTRTSLNRGRPERRDDDVDQMADARIKHLLADQQQATPVGG